MATTVVKRPLSAVCRVRAASPGNTIPVRSLGIARSMCLCGCRIGGADSRCGSWCARCCAGRSRPCTGHPLAPIRVWMNRANSSRNTSGLALVGRSANTAGRSISWTVVIALIPPCSSDFGRSLEESRDDLPSSATTRRGLRSAPTRTPLCWTQPGLIERSTGEDKSDADAVITYCRESGGIVGFKNHRRVNPASAQSSSANSALKSMVERDELSSPKFAKSIRPVCAPG